MTTLKLSEKTNAILSFDGAVFEVYSYYRVHVAQIESIKINTDRKGQSEIVIESPSATHTRFFTPVDEQAVPKLNQLIFEIQKAKAGFKFD
jgi:hypothetical protein